MQQIIDFHWKFNDKTNNYSPIMVLKNSQSQEITLMNLKGFDFKFNLSFEKYCVGYYTKGAHIPCPFNFLVSLLETQCADCKKAQGFISAFILGEAPNESMKIHLSKRHYIYLAFFPPNIVKVGTSAKNRYFLRPIEQDALLYTYIAEDDGFNIQKLEHSISKKLKISEFVKSSHKLKFLAEKINYSKAKDLLMSKFNEIKRYFLNTEFKTWIYDQINIINLIDNLEIFYPTKEVFFQKEELNLVGNYVGLRGKILIIENDNNYFAFDTRRLIGRFINHIDEWRYNLDMVQMNLGI